MKLTKRKLTYLGKRPNGKQKAFEYWSKQEKNDPTFWLDRGEYNTSEMVELASEELDIDEDVLESFADEYSEKGGSTYAGGGEIKQKALAHYDFLHYISPKNYGEMLLKRKSKKKTSC